MNTFFFFNSEAPSETMLLYFCMKRDIVQCKNSVRAHNCFVHRLFSLLNLTELRNKQPHKRSSIRYVFISTKDTDVHTHKKSTQNRSLSPVVL